MKVAIQGIKGSFHHQAARTLLGEEITLLECRTFRDVFGAVREGVVERGIVAIENSLHGSINPVYRLLAEEKLWICGEVRLHIVMNLIGSAPGDLGKLNANSTEVLSQIPALEQCDGWLNEHLPLAKRTETSDTAEAVRRVVNENNPHLLAIAGKEAAEEYDGTIIASPINDDPENYTRFIVLSNTPIETDAANRSSIIMTEPAGDRPGTLFEALRVFKELGINLSKLDSHPLPGSERAYAFYIDFDVSAKSPEGMQAIEKIKAIGWDIQLLGSYQV